jgi:hypothetical protein
MEQQTVQKKPRKQRAKLPDVNRGSRGFKNRNGRMKLLTELFDKHGVAENDVDKRALYDEANVISIDNGMPPLNRGSFAAMLCIYKKKKKEAA